MARLFHLKHQSADRHGGTAGDPLAAFSDELPSSVSQVSARTRDRTSRKLSFAWAIGLGVALTMSIAAIGWRMSGAAPVPKTGTVTVDTVPAGIKVAIDGRAQGQTPIALSLAPGLHHLTLLNDQDQRTIPLTVVAGQQSAEHFEFAATPTAQTVGTLSVTADVPSRVSVDGQARGSTPVIVPNLRPGDHLVSVTSAGGTVTRTVAISSGTTASAAFSFSASRPAGPAAGWMSVGAPFELQVFEGNDLIGSSGSKVMIAAGHHDIRLVNEALEYSETRGVDVTAGKVSAIQIDPPHTTLNINARPWADVSIDGTEIGQTPLANVSIAIGTHVVIFRHPQLGEQRRTITATTNGPNRVSADLTTK